MKAIALHLIWLLGALPAGVEPEWDLAKAWRVETATRERICINGLWRWQPAADGAEKVPADGWGFFKVPGCWPGISDYMQKDCQTLHPDPSFAAVPLAGVTAAFYQREIVVPPTWKSRRIVLSVESLNSFAAVFLDGQRAGELRFPGGELDITAACRPGRRQELTLLVIAMPLEAVMMSFGDTASARQVKGRVARRGLCGDVYLDSTPKGPRIADTRVETSVARGEITVDAALADLADGPRYVLAARVADGTKTAFTFESKPFRAADLAGRRLAFTGKWRPEELWDTHTPGNTLVLELTLRSPKGDALDAARPVRFGFREFRIEGRDFVLNDKRIHLSVVPFDNAQISAGLATKEGARESLERLKALGINFVYTHNYGCEPGSHLSFEEVLTAADEAGMLVAFSMPHFGHYEWTAPDADKSNGYAAHAEAYVRMAQNHPSVVAYAMSHNATGYEEDMNPDLMDGVAEPRNQWSQRGAATARRAEAIVRGFDGSRIVYHHSSGNLGSMHTVNFYANFVPAQELSDWFKHWAEVSVKPMFLCEYGSPLSWDFTMYRGWYKGKREFGSATVPWEFCVAEWCAQTKGDRAYALSEREKVNIRWEAAQFRAGKLWHRWDYPTDVGSTALTERDEVYREYIVDNWRAYRGYGLSAFGPWDHGHYFVLRDGVSKARVDLKTDWAHLQRPGFSPDYVEGRYERMDLAFDRKDWVPTAAGEALLRHNRPLLAFLGGGPGTFTEKGHDFLPGEAIEKQIVIVNDSRESIACAVDWAFKGPAPVSGRAEATVEAGGSAWLPLRVDLPADIPTGRYELRATFRFAGGETQEDSLSIDVLAPPAAAPAEVKIALFDPRGETAALLKELGVKSRKVDAGDGLRSFDVLVVGKGALAADGPGPDLAAVRDGLRVVVFEQTAEALEKRLGFRVTEYGLRRAFRRVSDHPLLTGLSDEHLLYWRGEATLLPPRLTYESNPGTGPTVRWCGLPVTRVWRCGNRGNVASVLIEKPARGDFLPVVDGGYALQYTPLMEMREGKGLVIFCQLDVTCRTEAEPAARVIVRNLLARAVTFTPAPARGVVYAGEPAGLAHLTAVGFAPRAYAGVRRLAPEDVLVAGPGAGEALASGKGAIAAWLAKGGAALAVSLSGEEIRDFLPGKVETKRVEHIGTVLPVAGARSLLAGISSADVMNRDPREIDLVAGGATVAGDGVLAFDPDRNVVFCQLAPWRFPCGEAGNLRKTYRRTSVLLTRLLGNLGAAAETPVLARFAAPAKPDEKRWLAGLYLDEPIEWDDPYRFFRW